MQIIFWSSWKVVLGVTCSRRRYAAALDKLWLVLMRKCDVENLEHVKNNLVGTAKCYSHAKYFTVLTLSQVGIGTN